MSKFGSKLTYLDILDSIFQKTIVIYEINNLTFLKNEFFNTSSNSLKFAVLFSEQQLVAGTYKLIVCFLTASITGTYFFCGTVITSWEHLETIRYIK